MSRNPILPQAYDSDAVMRLRTALEEGDANAQALLAHADALPWLAALAGHSPYLADLLEREPASLLRLLERGADEAFQLAIAPLSRADAATALTDAQSAGYGDARLIRNEAVQAVLE